MPTTRKNDARLDLRLPSEAKRLIERAAQANNQTISEFVVSQTLRSAKDLLEPRDGVRAPAGTPEERAAAFMAWVRSHRPTGEPAPDQSRLWDRDLIYGDEE